MREQADARRGETQTSSDLAGRVMEPGSIPPAPVFKAAAGATERTGQLVELSADLLATVALDGRVDSLNASWRRVLGWTERELRGQLFTEFVHPDDTARTTDEVHRAFAGHGRIEFENRCRARDGSYRMLSWRLALADGVALAAGTDITQLRLAEQAVHRLEEDVPRRTAEFEAMTRELEAFNYSVSHDLRAPLRAIDGFSAVVARHHAERLDESGQEMLGRVRSGVAKLNQLIDAMLVLSRLSRQDLRRQRVDLSEIAREIVGELRERDPKRRVKVLVADGLSAVGDRELLRVVLENLLGNAWRFTANTADARIEFRGEKENGCQQFVVRDNGAGFEMAYADRLFVPFQRLHREDEFPGVGAGLAIVQRIIHRHGGNIHGEGHPGSGAVFHFDLGRATWGLS